MLTGNILLYLNSQFPCNSNSSCKAIIFIFCATRINTDFVEILKIRDSLKKQGFLVIVVTGVSVGDNITDVDCLGCGFDKPVYFFVICYKCSKLRLIGKFLLISDIGISR